MKLKIVFTLRACNVYFILTPANFRKTNGELNLVLAEHDMAPGLPGVVVVVVVGLGFVVVVISQSVHGVVVVVVVGLGGTVVGIGLFYAKTNSLKK